MTDIRVKRIYEPAVPGDGQRVLVDRIWPRGVSRRQAAIDAWIPDVAPSHELRAWFNHDPDRWEEFQVRYRAELADNPTVGHLASLAGLGVLTLLYGARDARHNQAAALAAILRSDPVAG